MYGRPAALAILVVALLNGAVALQLSGGGPQGLDPLGAAHGTYAFLQDGEAATGNVLHADFVPPITVPGCPFSLPDPLPPSGASMAGDPGFPFRDANCNGAFNAGIDTPIPTAQVLDGVYDAGTSCLVIPPSVGPIVAPGIDLKGKRVTLFVNATATTTMIKLTATQGLYARDVVLSAESSSMDVKSAAGTISLLGMRILTDGGNVDIRHTSVDGALIDLAGTEFDGTGNILLTSKGDLHLDATTLHPVNGNIQFAAARNIVGHATVAIAANGNVQLDAGGRVTLDQMLLRSGTGNFQPEAAGPFRAHDACFRTAGNVQVETAPDTQEPVLPSSVDLSGTTVISEDGGVELHAVGSWVNVTAANITGAGNVLLDADGAIHANTSRLAAGASITLDVGTTANTAFVNAAIFLDIDGVARVKPAGAPIVGTPAQGGAAY